MERWLSWCTEAWNLLSTSLTLGWIAEVEGKDQRWVYHTDLTGASVVEAGSRFSLLLNQEDY